MNFIFKRQYTFLILKIYVVLKPLPNYKWMKIEQQNGRESSLTNCCNGFKPTKTCLLNISHVHRKNSP